MPDKYLKLGALLKAHSYIYYHITQISAQVMLYNSGNKKKQAEKYGCQAISYHGNQNFQLVKMGFRRPCVTLLGTTNK